MAPGRSYGVHVGTSADDIRDAQRRTWAALAPAWDAWDDVITAQLGPVTEAMVDGLALAPDAHHLDVASGTGEPGLTMAALCPRGSVVLTDLSPEMLEVARRKAISRGLANVDTRVAGAEHLTFPDGCFDSVSVRFGYMFIPDPATATAEFVRVLKPGGRLCAAVWADPDDNPWTGLVLDAVRQEIALPPPAPGAPDMYRFAPPGSLASTFRDAGLADVREWDVPVALRVSSAAEYWDLMTEHVSVVAQALLSVDDATRGRIRSRTVEALASFEVDDAVNVPGLARCILARA